MNGVSQELREFQKFGEATRKEREPKIILVRGTYKRLLEEEENLRTREGR